jgi:hypothetical protein
MKSFDKEEILKEIQKIESTETKITYLIDKKIEFLQARSSTNAMAVVAFEITNGKSLFEKPFAEWCEDQIKTLEQILELEVRRKRFIKEDFNAVTIDNFTDSERIYFQLRECGSISRKNIDEIEKRYRDYLENTDQSFFESIGSTKEGYVAIEIFFIEKMLYPGIVFEKWDDLTTAKKNAELLRIKVVAAEVLHLLSNVTNMLKVKYQKQTPLTVENYILHWETLIFDLSWIGKVYGYNLQKSLYFPFVEKWLSDIKEEYPMSKLKNRSEFIKQFGTIKVEPKEQVQSEAPSHREIIIAHTFKVKAGLESDKSSSQWKIERGPKGYQAYYTLMKQSKNYKSPTLQELQKAAELLKELPEVQKMAINKIEELQSL